MKNFILLGPPGSGKGTQAERITAKYGIPQISTGEIFRKNISGGTELGKKAESYVKSGRLVPDELVVDLVVDRLSQGDLGNGYMLDGFPRTIAQAEALEETLAKSGDKIDAVIYITADRDELIKRISGRQVCKGCGKTYHATNFPTKVSGVCDACGGEVYQRADDAAETVGNRIDVYNEQTMPLVGYYEAYGLLHEFDGMSGADAVFAEIEELFNA